MMGGDGAGVSPIQGVYFDELSKIRVLDTEKHAQTGALRDECKAFVEHIDQFQDTVGSLIELVLAASESVETQKLKAIGSRNKLQSLAQRRQAEKEQIQSEINERQAQLERLRTEFDALSKLKHEQDTLIERLVTQT
eukprot:m.445273 g.445273  ORF g.445273 m.445273 type:complete len:137 (+) comp19204_c0_seq1:5820-6230(+)